MIKQGEISRKANKKGIREQQIEKAFEKAWKENLSHQIKDLQDFKEVWRNFNKQLRKFEKCS